MLRHQQRQPWHPYPTPLRSHHDLQHLSVLRRSLESAASKWGQMGLSHSDVRGSTISVAAGGVISAYFAVVTDFGHSLRTPKWDAVRGFTGQSTARVS
jgi:hypothetical protein